MGLGFESQRNHKAKNPRNPWISGIFGFVAISLPAGEGMRQNTVLTKMTKGTVLFGSTWRAKQNRPLCHLVRSNLLCLLLVGVRLVEQVGDFPAAEHGFHERCEALGNVGTHGEPEPADLEQAVR